jgi:para-aminobenzoate synthetase/4-amino-4-deoxychorismate lyase
MNIDQLIKQVIENPYRAFFYTPPFYDGSDSYFFSNPSEIRTAKTSEDITKSLKKINENISRGLSGYGLIYYEAGYVFEKRLVHYLPKEPDNLVQFYFFDDKNVEQMNSEMIKFNFQREQDFFQLSDFHINTSKEKYGNDVDRIKKYIEEGDTYQVNYTVKAGFNISGDIISFIKLLIFNQSARYTAIINTGKELIISLSPELFFEVKGNKIIARPMKGTISRGLTDSLDALVKYKLANSEKDQAENLMIVDLIRNDLGRISEFGKVKVNELFTIEKYETLYQMISEVEAYKQEEITLGKIIENVFPCGSITGAPKIRTMEIINSLETERRGIYTGSIGLILKEFSAFNVAIRTITLNLETGKGEIGIGSGIVWDSDPEKEYNETLLKSSFLLNPDPYFELFETMLIENTQPVISNESSSEKSFPVETKKISLPMNRDRNNTLSNSATETHKTAKRIFLLDEHLERLKHAAEYFLFKFDEGKILQELSDKMKSLVPHLKYRLRLTLNKWGNINISISEYKEGGKDAYAIISNKTISSSNKFQYFKTSNRKLYDQEYKLYSSKGFFDTIFINEKNQLAEGAITNIFINKGGIWYTPPVSCGILPGIYRKYWLRTELNTKEEILYKDDLLIADEIILTNSLRGKVKVKRLYLNESEFKEFD